MTPVAHVTPVFVGGTTVRNATLHNIDEIRRKDLRVGDTVVLQRAGDVIPEVVSAVVDARDGSERMWEMPTACPVCGTRAEREEGEVVWRCPNPWCPAQRTRRPAALQRAGRDRRRGRGYAVVSPARRARARAGSRPTSSASTSRRWPASTASRRKSAENLSAAIQAARRRPLARILNALGISHVGEQTAIDLAAWLAGETPRGRGRDRSGPGPAARPTGCGTPTAEELTAVYGIGASWREAIARYFADEHTRDTLHHLIDAGVVRGGAGARRSGLGPSSGPLRRARRSS